ncbi:hypothetical protein BDN70DRAFT_871383 [Pholiota conissans]|uniref:AAA+ ATPase domain-containing protein n=1 Tax=Pholiota conissans TaxID=109636 RepID=A0A9P6D6Y3_9AGAR|nr:hypothetical protein BDN70DRAFT_871383 [Pholiota conissans]
MSSDKGKSVAAGTRKTRQALLNKAPLKQKTLLDSFFPTTASKGEVKDLPPVADTQESEQPTLPDEPPIEATLSALEDKAAHPEIIVVDDESSEMHRRISPLLTEPLRPDNNLISEGGKFINVDDSNGRRTRSPSIIILDSEIPKTLPTATTRPSAFQQRSTPEGRTPSDAIVVESSPVMVKAPLKSAKPVHPFFSVRLKSSTVPCGRKNSIPHVSEIPPYPDSISQHVRGTQTKISRASMFSTRTTQSIQDDIGKYSYEFLKRSTLEPLPHNRIYHMSTTINSRNLCDIPENLTTDHPAIAQMLTENVQNPFVSRRPWTDKWRPTYAKEVLGNEKSAIYLRNWLKALELQLEDSTSPDVDGENQNRKIRPLKKALKRARVVRAVEKKRKRSRIDSDEEDDWIVHTDESEDEHIDYEVKDDDFNNVLPASSPASNRSLIVNDISPSTFQTLSPPELGQLHNTILLSGPFGSGKTASVYACAEELGWDVFEVYPGIGRRNGANVENLIGEVGKNHLVVQNRQSGDAVKNFLWKKSKYDTTTDFQSSYSPRKRSALNITPEPEDTVGGVKPIRQSLILLEEVDILYKEDSNFWPTVLRIIKDCKRPVICTCNDISLVPMDELPLQSILHFEACPPGIAVPYLQALCAAEGRAVERELVSSLYTDPIPEQQDSDIFLAMAHPKNDLRQTINALQIVCLTANGVEYVDPRLKPSGNINVPDIPFQSQGKPLISVKRSESLSFLDGVLALDVVSAGYTGSHPSDDDEIGNVILHDRYAEDMAQIGMYDRHEDIWATAIRLSQELFDVDVKADALKTQTFEEQSRNIQYKHKCVLQELCPMSVWARQYSGTGLDYIPLIRQMVDAEDAQEAMEMQKKRGSGRNTRNSARSGYVRMIGITEEGRGWLGDCRLGS